MEVHAHTHTPRKKWTHYFCEFLMLFFAVFCRFLAENIREHRIEMKRGNEYLESYRNELLQQQRSFLSYKKLYQNKVIICDSIKTIFYTGKENEKLDVV